MKLEVPFLQLPVSFDAERLAQEVAAVGEDKWRPHPQGFPGNDALTLVSVDGDPESDAVHGPMRPTPNLLACPYLMQVMHAIGGVWGRSRLMRLSGQAEVTPHVDINYYWREHMRVHVPIVTQSTVRFHCGTAEINMAAGECWIFDTWRMHRVINDAERPRIHLVADTVGGDRLWDLVRRGRPHNRPLPEWQAERIELQPGNVPSLDLESYNLPSVMSPWEARDHLGFLIAETAPAPALKGFVQTAHRFLRRWQSLWAKYGDSGQGLDEYAAARDAFLADLNSFAMLKLHNSMLLVSATQAIVIRNLLASDAATTGVESRDQPAVA